MAQDSDNVLSLEPLRMLELFPVRKIDCLEFDLQKYKKLYEALSCVFCKQIFNNPTYLRCSHRFCKDCIEKHIRLNDKKSCPICRGQLTTKRDSKYDLKLISLISFAFGDASGFQEQINKFEQQAVKNITYVRLSAKQIRESMKETKQMKQAKQSKRQRQQSQDKRLKQFQTLSRKKSRRNVTQQQSSQKPQQKNAEKAEDDKKIKFELVQNKKILFKQKQAEQVKQKQKQIDPVLASKSKQKQQAINVQAAQPLIITTIQPPWKNTKNKQKKKKPQVILIQSEGSNQIQANKRNNSKSVQCKQKQQVISFNKLQEKQSKQAEKQISKQIQSSLNASIGEETNKQKPIINQIEKQAIEQNRKKLSQEQLKQQKQLQFFNKNSFAAQILQNRKNLKQNLKQDYFRTLILNSNMLCCISIYIAKKPKQYLTPNLPYSELKLSLNIKITQIKSFILSKFNNLTHGSHQKQSMLSLHVISQQNKLQILCQQNLTILDVIHKYWKNYDGLSMCEPKNMLQNLKPMKIQNQNKQNKNKRFLYYSLMTDFRNNANSV